MEIFGNKILDVLISLVLIYALLSILVSILIEGYNHRTKARGKLLKESIIRMLQDPHNLDWGHLFYNHHLIKGMKSPEGHLPQYIPAEIFSEVLCDILAATQRHENKIIQLESDSQNEKVYVMGETHEKDSYVQRFEKALQNMKPSPLSDVLKDYWEKSGENLDVMKDSLANWFNAYMDRVSGWYKSQQKKKFLIAGTCVALLLNVDSLHLIKVISQDDNLRAKLVQEALRQKDNSNEFKFSSDALLLSEENQDGKKRKWTEEEIQEKLIRLQKAEDSLHWIQIKKADSLINYLGEQEIPVGWSKKTAPVSWLIKYDHQNMQDKQTYINEYIQERNYHPGFFGILLYLLGVGISAISLSFGAPFWFDVLMKLVNLRQSGKKPEVRSSSKK